MTQSKTISGQINRLNPQKQQYPNSYFDTLQSILKHAQIKGYTPLTLPQAYEASCGKLMDDTTVSLAIAGKTRAGIELVVYSHVSTRKFQGLFHPIFGFEEGLGSNGTIDYSQEIFDLLVEADGFRNKDGNQAIFVLDYEQLKEDGQKMAHSPTIKLPPTHYMLNAMTGSKDLTQRILEQDFEGRFRNGLQLYLNAFPSEKGPTAGLIHYSRGNIQDSGLIYNLAARNNR